MRCIQRRNINIREFCYCYLPSLCFYSVLRLVYLSYACNRYVYVVDPDTEPKVHWLQLDGVRIPYRKHPFGKVIRKDTLCYGKCSLEVTHFCDHERYGTSKEEREPMLAPPEREAHQETMEEEVVCSADAGRMC